MDVNFVSAIEGFYVQPLKLGNKSCQLRCIEKTKHKVKRFELKFNKELLENPIDIHDIHDIHDIYDSNLHCQFVAIDSLPIRENILEANAYSVEQAGQKRVPIFGNFNLLNGFILNEIISYRDINS